MSSWLNDYNTGRPTVLSLIGLGRSRDGLPCVIFRVYSVTWKAHKITISFIQLRFKLCYEKQNGEITQKYHYLKKSETHYNIKHVILKLHQ